MLISHQERPDVLCDKMETAGVSWKTSAWWISAKIQYGASL